METQGIQVAALRHSWPSPAPVSAAELAEKALTLRSRAAAKRLDIDEINAAIDQGRK